MAPEVTPIALGRSVGVEWSSILRWLQWLHHEGARSGPGVCVELELGRPAVNSFGCDSLGMHILRSGALVGPDGVIVQSRGLGR